jgi:hypothetical protein
MLAFAVTIFVFILFILQIRRSTLSNLIIQILS